MGGVALRFCLVLGRVLMVVYCCGSGCFGCVWTHLLQMQSGRCLGSVITSSFRASPPTPSFQGERAKEVTLIVNFWVVSRCVRRWFAVAEAANEMYLDSAPIFSRCSLVVALAVSYLLLLGLQKATLGSFRGWCGAAFLSGFGACSDGGLLLRKRLLWMRLDPSSPDAVWSLPWQCNNFFF